MFSTAIATDEMFDYSKRCYPLATVSIVTSIAIGEFITRALLEGNPLIRLCKEKLWQHVGVSS